MSIEKQRRTAREYFGRGIASNQWSKPFDLDATTSPASVPDPDDERDATAVRRRIAEELREARAYEAELEGVSREREAERRWLAEACTPAWADEGHGGDSPNTATSRHPAASPAPIDPASPQAVAAREAAMDRLLARNWPGATR